MPDLSYIRGGNHHGHDVRVQYRGRFSHRIAVAANGDVIIASPALQDDTRFLGLYCCTCNMRLDADAIGARFDYIVH